METIKNKVFEFMLAADKTGAIDLIDQWAREHSYEKALTELLEPALQNLVRYGLLRKTSTLLRAIFQQKSVRK